MAHGPCDGGFGGRMREEGYQMTAGLDFQPGTSRQEVAMARYGRSAPKRVESAMRRRKRGTLRSGRSGKKVTSRKQAIAIGLSEARRKGGKVPARKKSARRKAARRRR
jgi:hypothetical protein